MASIGEAGHLLARAFAADPVITYFLAGAQRRRIALPAFFRAIILENLGRGHVYGAWEQGRLIGVAVWTPPEEIRPALGIQFRARANHAIVRLLFPWRTRGLYRGFGATASLHPTVAHWYLAFIGVDPSRQGEGVGRQLLAPVLERADAGEVLCYLETPFPATREFYQRLGFDLGPEARPFQGAPPIWTMVRRPEGKAKC
jgi:GNAT superfamily N-acetyltransferase